MKKLISPQRWDEDLIEWLQKQAKESNRSLANYCETALKDHRDEIEFEVKPLINKANKKQL